MGNTIIRQYAMKQALMLVSVCLQQIVERSHRALLVSSLVMVMVVAPDFLPSLHDE